MPNLTFLIDYLTSVLPTRLAGNVFLCLQRGKRNMRTLNLCWWYNDFIEAESNKARQKKMGYFRIGAQRKKSPIKGRLAADTCSSNCSHVWSWIKEKELPCPRSWN